MDELQTENVEPEWSYEQLVTVSAFIMPYEADIVRSLLESEEIPAFLKDYHTIYIKWTYSLALGGIRLQVRRNDLALAKEIIQSALLEGLHQTLEYSEGACPRCGSMKTAPVVRGRGWSALTWIILGMPLVWPWIRLRCSSCGNIWRDSNRSSKDADMKSD
jgi:hypothetical protein